MTKVVLLATILAAMLSTAPASAAEGEGHAEVHGPGYDFIEGGWSWLKAGHDGDGAALNISKSVSGNAFLYGGATFIGLDHGSADSWRIGAGIHTPVSDTWDFVARAAGQHLSEEEHASYGVQYEGGVKGKVTPRFEAWAMVGRSQWNDHHFHDQTFGRLGALYEFNHHWGITADAVLGTEEDEYFVGVSYLF